MFYAQTTIIVGGCIMAALMAMATLDTVAAILINLPG